MANINDYLQWRGDIKVTNKYRLTDVDYLILARFSFLPFAKINLSNRETIKSVSRKMSFLADSDFECIDDRRLIENLGESERFNHMFVTNFVTENDSKKEIQFSAVCVHINKKEVFVSYMVTSGNIYAWKEDFNMAFMYNVPSQVEGLKYLEAIGRKYPTKKFRIGGHSKGGNIAVYSSINVSNRIKNRIIKVYNYDGPGFNREILNNVDTNCVDNKIKTFLPQGSIVGRLLEHEEKYRVVESSSKGFIQHNIYSWNIVKDDFVSIDELTSSSDVINTTVKNWERRDYYL